MVFLAEDFAALVELANGDADIVEFGDVSDVDEFLGRQVDVVDLAEGREEGDSNCGGAGKAADGQSAFDDAADADLEPVVPGKDEGGAA